MERRLRTGAKADKPKVTSRQADYRFFCNAATLPVLNARHALQWPARVFSAALAGVAGGAPAQNMRRREGIKRALACVREHCAHQAEGAG